MQSELYAGIIAAALPLLIAAIVRHAWTNEQKLAASLALSVLVALGTTYFNGQIDLSHIDADHVGLTILLVVSETFTVYKKIWQPLGIAGAIEKATG